MNTILKRVISLVLCFVLAAGCLPVSVFATEAAEPSAEAPESAVVAVTGITLDRTEVEVGVGGLPMTLTATVQPEDAADKTVTWTSSDPGVVSVEDGVLTFGYMGEAVITATAGEFSASCTVTVGEGEWSDYVGDKIVVIAGSDYQASGASGTMQKIMNQIKSEYGSVYGALLGGDYDGGDTKTTAADIEAVDDDIDAVFPEITAEHRIYLQGNHESWSNLDPSDSNLMNETGAYDTDYYGVYAINHKDYPWSYSNPTASQVQATAAGLDAYLDAKADESYSKPIFVMSHMPLHYSTRTSSSGDGQYAKYLYDVLDEAGDKGLNIIFLFGHNHSGTYDDYLGGGQIYLEAGNSICVAEEGSKSSYFTDTLSFTYLNYGYVGAIKGKAGTNLSMTSFEITEEQVIVNRYGTSGTVELKATGVTTSGAPTADTSTVASGATITLNQFEPAAALTGITVTAPTKTAYVVGDELDTTGMVVTAAYDDGSTKTVIGYDVSADLSTAGTKTITVTYKEKTATFEVTVYAPVEDTTTGVTVAAPGVTGVTATMITEEVPEGSDYSAFVAYDITPAGYTSGAATVTVPVPASFDAGRPVMILDGDTVQTTTTIKNGTVTFTATHFSIYAVAQTAESALDWKEIPGGIVYQLDTDGLTAGIKYLIVNTGADGSGVALRNAGGEEGTTNVTISGGKIILEADTDVAWTPNSATSGHLKNQEEYLRVPTNSYNDLVTGSSSTIKISNEGNGAYQLYVEGRGGYWGSSGTYYLAYSSGSWDAVTTESNVYLYECKGTGNGGYAAISGTIVYNVITNTTTADALETQIRDNLVVYTSANEDGTDATATTEYTLAGTVNPAEAGEYTYTVTYGGVTLGAITVYVVDKEIDSFDISSISGAVNKGASSAASTGATLVIKYKDGSVSDPIPVTVGMLSNADGTSVSTKEIGSIENLVVKYNGQVVKHNGQEVNNFTLTVNPKEGNNYPNYPDPGAVKVNKTATGIDFQASGVATVELSASGIPMNEGVDVVIVLDTSSSMSQHNKYPDENGTEMYRIELLRPAVNNLIQQMKTKREDGSDPDIDIAIVTFNGNTVKADTNEIGGAGSRGTNYGIQTGDGTIADAWEKISEISSSWATDDSNANTPTGSGTNYDYGLQTAYDLLAQKKVDSEGERQQFVLFLSDGSPSQYNGAESNDGATEYVDWIRGNYDVTDTDTSNDIPDIENPEFYTGFNNNNGQLHRSAEAIKASTTETKEIIRFDSSGVGTLETVDGLGATMYSIGLLLESAYARTEEDQIAVLKTIASDDRKFFNIDSVTDLSGAFTAFTQEVLLAATNARFEDQMGAMYDLQLTPVDYLPTGETTNYSTINPTIEVRSYEIWTRAEYEAGTITDLDLIGTRKTNEDGSYKYTTLETITFNYTKNGTNDYTLTGATSDQLGDTNILNNNVVCGNYFYYNTTNQAVTVDGITVGAETFYWKLGDIKTTELAIRYNVYLTGALDGDRAAGSYETNQSAILYYDNYLGNPCKKETISPTMAWKGAVVRYAFYLVDASSGKPVNNEGTEVPFAQRTVIVNPTVFEYINLFSSDAVESKEVVAGHLLPEGYWLYDEGAQYKITVRGNGTGEWTITGTDTVKNPNSTYVTGYDGDKYTYEDSKNVTGHDYTHTTVWFAVKWEPKPIADTVVIDYGLPVDVHVLTNDMFGKYGKLIGVACGDVTGTAKKTENDVAQTNAEGYFGTAVVNVPETGYTDENSVIRYTPTKDKAMQMKEPDVFTYSVQYANPVEAKNDGFYYGTLTVIPATTIYYEDAFLNLKSYSRTDGSADYTEADLWTQVTESTATQDEDRPGDINFAFDTVIDADSVYGYDSAYETMATHSLGNAAKVTVDANKYATAEFTFAGTGFDVISLASNTTGAITVLVKDASGKVVKNTLVDTFYGMNADGSPAIHESETIYQVPVIKIFGLPYGTYTVKITAAYNSVFDHNKEESSYDLYLDAIRIYDPTGNQNQTANDAYVADGEGYPVYEELRNNIIRAASVTVTKNEDGTLSVTTASGNEELEESVFFIDCNDGAKIAEYVSYGPNNEVYLAKNQAIAFTVAKNDAMVDIQLGMKVANGTSVAYTINDDSYELATTTDMYYSIWDYAKGGNQVIIMNTGDGILSLTNLKATFEEKQKTTGPLTKATQKDAANALASLMPKVETETPEITGPVIVTQPASYEGTVGDTVTFTVEAEGEGLSYQWFYKSVDSEKWLKSYSAGAATASLSVELRAYRNGQEYRCQITDANGEFVVSDAAAMTLKVSKFDITAQPVDFEGSVGDTAEFAVTATGENLTYRWQYSNDNGITWKNSWSEGYATAALKVPVLAYRNGQQYRCVISNGREELTSDAAAIVVNFIKITAQPVDAAGAAGENAVFTVEAEGEGLKYCWYRSYDDGETWVRTWLTGYNTNELSFVITAARAETPYKCIITDAYGNTVDTDVVCCSAMRNVLS